MSVDNDVAGQFLQEYCLVDTTLVKINHRGSHSDLSVLAQIFTEKQYDIPRPFHEPAFAYHQHLLYLGKTPLIVDAGANIGAAARWLCHKWPPCHVIAVEPDAGNFAVLASNAADLSATLYHAGIDWQDGQATLVDPGHGEFAYQTAVAGDGPLVPMVSLRTLLRGSEFHPFILKIDIEGAEASMFAADTSPAALFPIVVLEPHDWMLPGQGTSVPFFRWHAAHGRELTFAGENIFSIDWKLLTSR